MPLTSLALRNLTARILRSPAFKKAMIALGILAASFVLMNFLVMPLYVKGAGIQRVPDVTSKHLDSASSILHDAGLTPVQAETKPDPRYPVGTVVQQNPPPGSEVKSGRRVYLTISGGEILVTVPKLRGLSTRDARFTLERFGLTLGSVRQQTSDDFPENTIIDQSVAQGRKVPRGSSVGITVSTGPVMEEILVPKVIGLSVSEAERTLIKAGLKVGNITYLVSEELLPNTIIDQFPRPDESAPQGTAVDLFVVQMQKEPD